MSDLETRLADANPVSVEAAAVPSFEHVWRRFETATTVQGESLPMRRGHARRRRRLTYWTAAGAATVAVAVGVLVLGTSSGGLPALSVPSAFAGWSPKPTAPAKGRLQAATSECGQTATPTLADTRGPFTLLLFAQTGAPIDICTSFSTPPGKEFSGGVSACTATPGGSVVPCTVGGETSTGAIAADSIAVAGRIIRTDATAHSAYSIVYGQTGSGVTAVSLMLSDGSQVQATVENGLFAAWWPDTEGVQAADITTANRTSSEPLDIRSAPASLGMNAPTGGPPPSTSGATG